MLRAFPPTSLPEVVALRDVLLQYTQAHPVCAHARNTSTSHPPQRTVALGMALVYAGMQTFAIPGTLTLSLLSGALFGQLHGLAFVAGRLDLISVLLHDVHSGQHAGCPVLLHRVVCVRQRARAATVPRAPDGLSCQCHPPKICAAGVVLYL